MKYLLIFLILNNLIIALVCITQKHKSPFIKAYKDGNQNNYYLDCINKDKFKYDDYVEHKSSIKDLMVDYVQGWLRLNLFITAYIPSNRLRYLFYKYIYQVGIDRSAIIHYGCEIRNPWNLVIMGGAIIGDKNLLDARGGLYIGNNVNTSSNAQFYTLQHDMNDSWFRVDSQKAPIIVEDRAWVSTNSIILPGCKIAEGAVIAAGCVVTKSVEPYTVNGGVPNKVISKRNNDLRYEFKDNYRSKFL